MWQFAALISVYFRPTETPISALNEISLKPPISADSETGISVYHYPTAKGNKLFTVDFLVARFFELRK